MSDKSKKKSDDRMVSMAEKMAEDAQRLVANFLESIVRFMRDAAHWYEDASKRIREYLKRFFLALLKFMSALGKLSLFYIPSLILLFIGIVKSSYLAYITAAIWMLTISAIGLSYKRREISSSIAQDEEKAEKEKQ